MKISECTFIEPFTCTDDESMFEVAKKLRSITLRHIFVVDKDFCPAGIISIVDVNNRLVAEGKNPKDTVAKDIMSTPIDIVDVADDVNEVAGRMIKKNRVMNAVVKDGRMVGIITLNQLLDGAS